MSEEKENKFIEFEKELDNISANVQRLKEELKAMKSEDSKPKEENRYGLPPLPAMEKEPEQPTEEPTPQIETPASPEPNPEAPEPYNTKEDADKLDKKLNWNVAIAVFSVVVLYMLFFYEPSCENHRLKDAYIPTTTKQRVAPPEPQIPEPQTRTVVKPKAEKKAEPKRTYKFPSPKAYTPGTAERCMAEFLYAWHKHDYKKMVSFTQLTWRSDKSDLSESEKLRALFSLETPLTYEIMSMSGNNVCRDFKIKIIHDLAGRTQEVIGSARVIKESGPYDPSEYGTWGVNPSSALRLK